MVKPEVGDKGGSSTDEEVKWKLESENKISMELKSKWKVKVEVTRLSLDEVKNGEWNKNGRVVKI